jgi:hypothetical protein
MWVRAMERYGNVYREVAPKQEAVKYILSVIIENLTIFQGSI